MHRALVQCDPVSVERLLVAAETGVRVKRGMAHPDDRMAAVIESCRRKLPWTTRMRLGVNGTTVCAIDRWLDDGSLAA